MVAAPQFATMLIRHLNGKSESIDVWLSDVDGGALNFDSGAGAGVNSEKFYTFPVPVVIEDFSIAAGMTDTTAMRWAGSGRPTSNILRFANHLNTLSKRPKLNIPVKPGSRISAIQQA